MMLTNQFLADKLIEPFNLGNETRLEIKKKKEEINEIKSTNQ